MSSTKVKYGRGRTMKRPLPRGTYSERFPKTLSGFKEGDVVRLKSDSVHYEVGCWTQGTIVWLWDNGSVSPNMAADEVQGANVRVRAEDNTDQTYIGDGSPAFDEGGYALSELELV